MRNSMIAGLIASSMLALPVFAQQAPTGAQVTASSPGKAAVAETVKASALVTAIDKASRTVTLKPAHGASFEVECGDEVKNFDQIAVGDQVVVQYARALSLEVKKSGGAAAPTERADAVRAKPGEKPAGAIGHQVTVMTEVIDVNPKNKTITLKGPKGNVVVLDVKNPEQFKAVKKGDKVEAVYTEALAISVEPAAKKAPKK
jgi:Cu/Ag efflux protein CusF